VEVREMALTQDKLSRYRDGHLYQVPVAANTKIYSGAIVCADAAGRAVPATAAANRTVLGVAIGKADNTGGLAGAINVTVRTNYVEIFKNSAGGAAVTAAHRGQMCYVADDETVRIFAAAPAVNVPAGTVFDVTTEGVLVNFEKPGVFNIGAGNIAIVGDLDVSGDLDVAGDIDGDTITAATGFVGDLTGDVEGDLTGNVTSAAAADLELGCVAGQDVIIKVGDAAGANKVSIVDSADAEQASINSDGLITAVGFAGPLTGAVTGNASTATIGNGLFLHSADFATIAPTDAEMIAAFGARTSGLIYDTDAGNAGAGAVLRICGFDGAAWWQLPMTKGL